SFSVAYEDTEAFVSRPESGVFTSKKVGKVGLAVVAKLSHQSDCNLVRGRLNTTLSCGYRWTLNQYWHGLTP
ncbi:MAG TPA: hypothetical protein V6C63_15990, partial [Allocoleopsis sp.]